MATHAWIADRELAVLRVGGDIDEAAQGLAVEVGLNGGGKCYPCNSDQWGTLAVNLLVLASNATKLADKITKARTNNP